MPEPRRETYSVGHDASWSGLIWDRDLPAGGPVVVALHGFTGSGCDWELPVETFGATVGQWIAPDLPGHGDTTGLPSPEHYSLAGIREGLRALLADLPARPWLMGYSMGGRAAIEYAVHYPETIAGLVLIGATAGISDPAERSARQAADATLAKRIEELGMSSFADEWEAHPLLRSQEAIPSPWRERLRTRRRRQDPRELAQSLRLAGSGAMTPRWNALDRLKFPVLVTHGSADRKFERLAGRLVERLPTAFQVRIRGAGHSPHLETPDDFRNETAILFTGSGSFASRTAQFL